MGIPRQISNHGTFPVSDFKNTPLQHVRTVFASFIQGLFYAAPIGSYHWTPILGKPGVPDSTEIIITDENPIHTETVAKRPAVTISRGPVQFFTLGKDDILEINLDTGRKVKSVLVTGYMTINCLSRLDIETENIAWIIAESLWLHRSMLMKVGFHDVGQRPQIGSPTSAGSVMAGDGADEWYNTAVSVPFQFYRTSAYTPINASTVQSFVFSMASSTPVNKSQGPSEMGIGAEPYNVSSDAKFSIDNSEVGLPLVPHPLNPNQLVTIRKANPYAPELRGSKGRGAVAIGGSAVKQSESKQVPLGTTKFKV